MLVMYKNVFAKKIYVTEIRLYKLNVRSLVNNKLIVCKFMNH